jgi:hypothetical protein
VDIDIIADIKTNHIPYIKQNLEKHYYIDQDMIKEAIDKESSFNLIHLETAIKVDVFILKNNPYQKKAIQRKIQWFIKCIATLLIPQPFVPRLRRSRMRHCTVNKK